MTCSSTWSSGIVDLDGRHAPARDHDLARGEVLEVEHVADHRRRLFSMRAGLLALGDDPLDLGLGEASVRRGEALGDVAADPAAEHRERLGDGEHDRARAVFRKRRANRPTSSDAGARWFPSISANVAYARTAITTATTDDGEKAEVRLDRAREEDRRDAERDDASHEPARENPEAVAWIAGKPRLRLRSTRIWRRASGSEVNAASAAANREPTAAAADGHGYRT